jgi:hypothetical protein
MRYGPDPVQHQVNALISLRLKPRTAKLGSDIPQHRIMIRHMENNQDAHECLTPAEDEGY